MVATKDTLEHKPKSGPAKKPQTEPGTTTTKSAAERAPEQGTKIEARTQAGVERTRSGRVYTPAVDIYEAPDAIVLVADMPGVDENSVDVTLDRNVLTIYGHVEPWKPEGYTLAYAEYGVGDYQRSFTISNQIDWQHIEGIVKNGVLRVTLPKAGPAGTKKIEIRAQH